MIVEGNSESHLFELGEVEIDRDTGGCAVPIRSLTQEPKVRMTNVHSIQKWRGAIRKLQGKVAPIRIQRLEVGGNGEKESHTIELKQIKSIFNKLS